MGTKIFIHILLLFFVQNLYGQPFWMNLNLNEENEVSTIITNDTLQKFDVIDSFFVVCEENRCAQVQDITYGNGFLWILSANGWEPDTIYKIDPKNGFLVNSYEIPFPTSYFSHCIDYDSVSSGGPYFWLAVEIKERIVIYKLFINGLKIDTIYNTPDKWPSDVAIHNDSLWITGTFTSKLYVLDLVTKQYSSFFPMRPRTYGNEISPDKNNDIVLWVIEHDYEQGEYGDNSKIHKINPYTGDIIKSYRAPDPWPFGVCWENESPGGPYLWICDYETNKVYKVKEPGISNINDGKPAIYHENIYVKANPKPFAETTNIKFNLEVPRKINFTVFNALGYCVRILADDYLDSGNHEFIFDGSNLPSGTYYYVLKAGSRIESGKLIHIK